MKRVLSMLVIALLFLFNVPLGMGGAPTYTPLNAEGEVPMIEFSVGEIISALLAIVSLCIAVYAVARRGGNVDARIVELLQERQADRPTMEVYEKGYAAANEATKGIVQMGVTMLRIFEAVIPGNADTAVRKFLEDVQTPGTEPADPAPPPAVG